MVSLPSTSTFLLLLLFQIQAFLVLCGDPAWWPKVECRDEYMADPFEMDEKQWHGGNYYKEQASKCTGNAGDPCLKYCVFQKIQSGEVAEKGQLTHISLVHFLKSVYTDQDLAADLDDHISANCDHLLSTPDAQWNCAGASEGFNCIESYLNCSKGLKDFAPSLVHDLSCHKIYNPKYLLPEKRRKQRECYMKFTNNPVCAKACVLDNHKYLDALKMYRGNNKNEAILELHKELRDAGMKKEGTAGRNKELDDLITKMLKTCDDFYEMKQSKTCDDSNKAYYEPLVECFEKFWTCKA